MALEGFSTLILVSIGTHQCASCDWRAGAVVPFVLWGKEGCLAGCGCGRPENLLGLGWCKGEVVFFCLVSTLMRQSVQYLCEVNYCCARSTCINISTIKADSRRSQVHIGHYESGWPASSMRYTVVLLLHLLLVAPCSVKRVFS